MEIVYIWDGRNALPERRRACVQSALDLYPEATFSCITRLRHFVSPQFKVIPWDEILFQMTDYFNFKGIPYTWLDPMHFSDWARFWYLAHHPDTLYLDTDATVLKRLPLGDKALCPPNNIHTLYSPPGFDGEHFLKLMKDQSHRHVGLLLSFAHRMKPEWSDPLPEGFVDHHG